VPVVNPVTRPVPSTEAFDVLVHIPPVVTSLKRVVNPTQTVVVPVIAEGSGLTVTAAIERQPDAVVYVIFAVPALAPETSPLLLPTLAVEAAELLQTPPPILGVSSVLEPTQTCWVPVIPGVGLTVTDLVETHPLPRVYVIVVDPATIPVTMPPVPTLAIVPLALDHIPLAVTSLNAVVEPSHTVCVPVIAAGEALTVAIEVATQPLDVV